MNYERLISFVAFADHLNFTRAARALHITQPALHAQVRKLGDEVGMPLYQKKGRVLVLTPQGRQLAAYGREVVARGEQVLAALRGGDPLSPLVLASGQGAFHYLLGPAIRQFLHTQRQLRVLAMSGPDTVDAVLDARADLGVAVLDCKPRDIQATLLCRVGQMVVVPSAHRLARRRKLLPKDLDGESIVVAPEPSPHRRLIAAAMSAHRAQWNVAVEAMGWELMIQFVSYGLGIGVVNDFCSLPRGMIGIPLQAVPSVSYYLLMRTSMKSDAALALASLIINTTRR